MMIVDVIPIIVDIFVIAIIVVYSFVIIKIVYDIV